MPWTLKDCPGPGKCHGCLSWCDNCGDVDMVCDDPNCSAHDRLEEVQADVDLKRRSYRDAQDKANEARREYTDAAEFLMTYKNRTVQMVPRIKDADRS